MTLDQKAGWCSRCRGGDHDLCVKDRHGGKCECDAGVKRGHRPPDTDPVRPVSPPPSNGRPLASVPVERPSTAPSEKPSLVRWEDPPPKTAGIPTLARAVQDELRRHVGRWARVKDYKSKSGAIAAAGSIRKGTGGLVAGEWESVARRTETGSTLYVRFVGKRDADG